MGGVTTSQTGLRERCRRRVQKTSIWLPQSLSTISLPLWSSSLRDCPVTRDCILEAFKMTSTGPLVNMEGEKTGGVYSARKFLLFSPTEAWSPVTGSVTFSAHWSPLSHPYQQLDAPQITVVPCGIRDRAAVSSILPTATLLMSRPNNSLIKNTSNMVIPSSQNKTVKHHYGVLNTISPRGQNLLSSRAT